ncbi:heavy-metal-associated domain-containing protein [Thauera mechernichensis]|uniref:Heavy-metal-associated domain-containing protein n=1 Tax=Thauera mechernichensis TaxID=82788 RepID=A0ABW3WH54_9RHOO|nr:MULTISPECIES: cation transporter [Thauera]ENO81618.1 Heavy metal transport/detoxification protein [Thauera sp. 27]ENO94287.1 Heavy metal transport/detoxification protein [Thauera sp. 28]MDG3063136.1 cation transporter [Thauera mechernichensis]WBL63183.1 cation transporter [Thauera sp. WB-2]HAG76778.1 copper chaperone [Thauera sp.]
MSEVTIKVEGMSCGGCVRNVTGVLKGIAGVEDVQVSLEQGSATVRFDPAQVSVDAMRAAVEDAGFDAPA